MKSINSLLTKIGIETLKRCSPIQIEALQAWLRALADALPALQRDPEKLKLSEIAHCVKFTKAQTRAQIKVSTKDGEFPSGDMWLSMSNLEESKEPEVISLFKPKVTIREQLDGSLVIDEDDCKK